MPDRGKLSIVCAALLLCALTACTSTPAANPVVKIPTFDSPAPSVVTTTDAPSSTDEPPAPIVEPPSTPPSSTPKPRPKPSTTKTTPPPPPPSTFTPEPPSTTFTLPDRVRLGAPCDHEGAIGITREGELAVCTRGNPPKPEQLRWTKA